MREIKFRALINGMIFPVKKAMFGKSLVRVWYIIDSIERSAVISCEKLMQYAGFKIKHGEEVYEGHILKIKLSAIDNADGDDFVSPKKTLLAEVVINPKSGAKAKVRKIIMDPDYCNGKCFHDDTSKPCCSWHHNCLSVGRRINIRKTDEIIGNVFINPEILK